MHSSAFSFLKDMKKQHYVANWFPITDILPDNKTCVSKSGTICQVIKLGGKDYTSLSPHERSKLFQARKQFFEKIDEDLEVSIFACRKKFEEEPTLPDYNNEYAQAIAEKVASNFTISYKTEIYIVVKSSLRFMDNWSGIGSKAFKKEEAALMARASTLTAQVDLLIASLESFDPVLITHHGKVSELVSFWSYFMNGGTAAKHTTKNTNSLHNVIGYSDIEFVPREPVSLYKKLKETVSNHKASDHLYQDIVGVVSEEISKSNNAYILFSGMDRKRYAAILFLKHYPQVSDDKLFDALLSIQREICLVQHFTPFNKEIALEKTQLQINQLQNFGRFIGSRLNDLNHFADGLVSDDFQQMNHSMNLLVFGDSTDEIDDSISSITSSLGGKGINIKREEGYTEPAYWSMFPDYEEFNFPRRVPITTETASDFCTFGAKPFGEEKCSFGDYPVTHLKTTDGQNFAFTFHGSEQKYVAGHTLIVGDTGSGKSVTTSFLLSQCLKFNGHGNEDRFKALVFDSLNGLKVPINAFGGDYIDINDKGFVPLNPLQLPETDVNKAFLEQWIKSLCKDVDAREIESIQAAIRANYNDLTLANRSLNAVRLSFGVAGYIKDRPNLAKQLEKWLPNEDDPNKSDSSYGMFFNAPRDALSFDKQLVGFDMTFLKDNPELLAPLTSYLFHTFETFVDRNPCPHMFFMDEAFNFIKNPIIYEHILKALKEWRKRNGMVVAAIQDLETLGGMTNGQEFMQSFQTYILFKDPKASPKYYMGRDGSVGVGLNEAEYNWIKSYSGGKREVMIKRRSGESIILDIDLSHLGKHLNLLRGEKEAIDIFKTYRDEKNWQELYLNSF